jgi:hypothetical protein
MKIIVCAYRQWAIDLVEHVRRHPRVTSIRWVMNNDDLASALHDKNKKWDMVLFVGWSSPPSEELVNLGVPMFSEHPATSDRYSPGSPLQNQILDGVQYTKHRLVKVGFPELSPRQWCYEVDMDLSGNMSDILKQMTATSKHLLNMFLDNYPNVVWKSWPEQSSKDQVPRRVPEQSCINNHEFLTYSTKELYDRIRCLEDPYPNAYIEDGTGILYFERVRFRSKK